MRLLCGLFLWSTIWSVSHAETLTDVVRTAIETNPNIEAALIERRASEYRLDQARGRLLPEVELLADYGSQRIDRPEGIGPDENHRWRNRRKVTLSVKQVLFDGFDRANEIYRSEARITSATFKALARSEAIALNAVEAYIDIERHNKLLTIANANVQRHVELLKITQDRIDGGKAPESDAVQTQERLEAAKALVSQIKIARDTTRAKFKNAVGRNPGRLSKVPAAHGIPRSSAGVVEIAMSNNPELGASEARSEIAEYERQQFRSSLFPQVYLEGSASRGEELEGTPGKNDELKASVVLRWRLFDGGIRRNRDLELAEIASQRRAEQQILARDITERIEASWARWSVGRSEVNALAAQVRENNRVVGLYESEYEAGNRTLLDVLDAESSKFAAEFQFYNARALQLFAGYRLLGNMGTLLTHFGIAPPVDDRPLNIETFSFREANPFEKLKIPPLK